MKRRFMEKLHFLAGVAPAGELVGCALIWRVPSQTYSSPEKPVQMAAELVSHSNHRSGHFIKIQITTAI